MRSEPQTRGDRPIPVVSLPQVVPSEVCFRCDVCCRFPEPDSFLRPYFTAEEIQRAVARGIDRAHFSDPNGCQVTVVPTPSGEGYLCPAFDPATSHCRIYDDRPLDCQIYPLAVMWNAPATGAQARPFDKLRAPSTVEGGARHEARGERPESSPLPVAHRPLPAASAEKPQVVLGWDAKCPFMREAVPADIQAHADRVAERLGQDDMVRIFAMHQRLIGPFQDDVVILATLPKLTACVSAAREVKPLTPDDWPIFERALRAVETPLAQFALAPHLIWKDLFRYSWAEIEGHFCLFAEYPDGLFMPLPPLSLHASRFTRDALAACFAIMRVRNRGSGVSRIENVPEEWKMGFEAAGYRVKPKDPDYLYRTADLIELAGDRYKSQRAACNRFEREHPHSFEPYQDADRAACLALFRDWFAQKQAAGLEEAGRHMLGDSEAAHREAFTSCRDLGLVGRVVRINGAVRAYTFGYQRSPAVFCVLLEVADRTIPGLAPFIFREFCREAAAGGAEFVNTMDDSGLPSLAQSKRAYHPVRLVPSFIVTEP